MNSDEEDDRTVIRPPSARTQGPGSNVPRSHHATQQHGAPAGDGSVPTTSPPARTQTGSPTMAPTVAVTRTALSTQPSPAPPPSSGQHTLTLPAGTRLGEFEVTQTIGEGGFGIVYLAWDHSLQRKVALKEYMPSAIASRVGATEIRPRSERHQETFEAGLKSFINEARLLAQFDHPSLLKVYRFWEANGTAYMVMPFLEGTTLRDTIRGLPGPPDEAWILSLLAPLVDALTMLHAAQCYHRDIAPDNILLMADTGRPLLLDFGAARRVIGDMTQALTAILKPGYAPVEQYAEVPGLKQGPWTDVYALAAVVHWMILGKTPSPSVGRMFDDAMVPVTEKAAGRYSEQFLSAIDRALAVLPDKRTQTIEAFRQDLMGGAGGGVAAAMPMTGMPGVAPGGAGRAGSVPPTGGPTAFPATVGAATRTVQDERTRQLTRPPRTQAPVAGTQAEAYESPPAAATAAPRSKLPLAIGGLVGVAAVAVAAVVLWPKADPVPVPTTGTTTAPVKAPETTVPATTTAPTTAATTTPSVTAPATVPATTTAPATTAPATTAPATTTATTTPPITGTATPPATTSTVPVVVETPPATTVAPPVKRPPRERPPAETRPADTRPPETRPPAETRPAETRSADNKEECSRLFQRLSLGEADQALMDRIRTLRCR